MAAKNLMESQSTPIVGVSETQAKNFDTKPWSKKRNIITSSNVPDRNYDSFYQSSASARNIQSSGGPK